MNIKHNKKQILSALNQMKPKNPAETKNFLKFLCADRIENMSKQRIEILIEVYLEQQNN